MPIKLVTGTPGAGKTLLALEQVLKDGGIKDRSSFARIKEQIAEGKQTRPIVVCGVEGLRPDLFVEMDSPLDWEDYDDGTLFLVDEAWKWLGVQVDKLNKDERFLKFAEHRHRGMDFIMTTQMPAQLHQHIRGLVNPHIHVTRKFGTKATVTYEWPHCVSNPNSKTAKSTSIEKLWSQPTPVYEMYQSATLHTIKRNIPFKVAAIPVVVIAVVGALGGAVWAAKNFVDRDGKIDDPNKLQVEAGSLDEREKQARLTAATTAAPAVTDGVSYLALREPRVPQIPTSAPIFDGRKVVSYPRLLCIAGGEDGMDSCRCVTEQNTRVNIDFVSCQEIARWGGMYDEYREESEPVQQMQASTEQQPQHRPGAYDPIGEISGSAGTTTWRPEVDPSFGKITRPGTSY